MKMPALIQEETKLVQLAEAMADAQQIQPENGLLTIAASTEVTAP